MSESFLQGISEQNMRFCRCQHTTGFAEQSVTLDSNPPPDSHTHIYTRTHILKVALFEVCATKPVKAIICDIFICINSCFAALGHLSIKTRWWTLSRLFASRAMNVSSRDSGSSLLLRLSAGPSIKMQRIIHADLAMQSLRKW